jgi:hypothetical protein
MSPICCSSEQLFEYLSVIVLDQSDEIIEIKCYPMLDLDTGSVVDLLQEEQRASQAEGDHLRTDWLWFPD